MIYTISNETLTVKIDSLGGELQSITKDGAEYLWQADPAYWSGKAPNLFPYVGRLTGGKYQAEGKTYEMSIHGFVKNSELAVAEQSQGKIVFQLEADEKTLECYPYHFVYRIVYELEGGVLRTVYEVKNTDKKTIYFGIGAHPGFCVPLEDGLQFEDYCLEFAPENEYDGIIKVGLSDTCFPDGTDAPFVPEEEGRITLKHSLFDRDAIVLTHMPKAITLKSDKGNRSVTVSYPDMDYLGLWHKPHSDAPYVCIEPWKSLPSRQDVVEELSTQPGLVRLEAGTQYVNCVSIEIR